jgi:hypothetical protein
MKYEGTRKFLILFPENHLVEDGYELETDDKQFIKDLKELGFKVVKANTKKEGDE